METPEPITKKIDTVDYVREATPCAKFCANPSTGGLLGKCVKYNRNFSDLYLFFLKITYRSDRLMDFHAQWLKRRGLTQGCALLGLKVQNHYLMPKKSRKR